jgi:hypothetical protein
MNTLVYEKNIASLGVMKRLSAHSTATAAGSGDATSVTGISIDRQGFTNGGIPKSAMASVIYQATLASGKTLSIGYAIQDSADNSTFADFQTATYAVVATGPSGGGEVVGSFNVAVDLSNARRYVRMNYNPDLSATGTDTAYADAVGFMAGFDRLAAPTT